MTHPPAASATDFQPRWYRRRPSTFWFAERRSYRLFVLRELSSLFVAWFVVFLLLLVRAIGAGPLAYREFAAWSAQPWVLALNIVAWLFVLLHAVTWFAVAPDAIALRVRGLRVPRHRIIIAHYAVWALVSAFMAWLILAA
jgi:fumarate reductase subunit C